MDSCRMEGFWREGAREDNKKGGCNWLESDGTRRTRSPRSFLASRPNSCFFYEKNAGDSVNIFDNGGAGWCANQLAIVSRAGGVRTCSGSGHAHQLERENIGKHFMEDGDSGSRAFQPGHLGRAAVCHDGGQPEESRATQGGLVWRAGFSGRR